MIEHFILLPMIVLGIGIILEVIVIVFGKHKEY